MENLPLELLSKIMLYLPPVDRLSCSLTCRRWAAAMASSELLNDVWLDIPRRGMATATSVLANTQRQYTKLLLYRADLSESDSAFWERIGAHLRVLDLEKCSWSTHVFYAILQQCTKLESLKLVQDNSREISINDFILPESVCSEKLRHSLSHIRHLHLDIKVTAEVLDLLLGLMPNVTSIFLSSRFDKKSGFLERLPSILKKNRIIRTGADFSEMDIGSEEVIKFLEITSGTLEELCMGGTRLTESACDSIVNCTKLRRLTLHGRYPSFNSCHLKKLVSNSPDIETLELYGCENFEDEDVVHLLELNKLRSLTLGVVTEADEFLRSLGDVPTLVKLGLKCSIVDSGVRRSLACLTNLRSLVLDECADSDCFEAICEKFERLTELDLGKVENLTDADGMKLCRFKELRSLSFSGGFGFTDLTFENGVGSRAMKSLNIHGCSLTDVGLASIASHHDRLEELSLHKCENITDDGMVVLLQNEPRLKKLRLMSCASVPKKLRLAVKNLCLWLRTPCIL